MERYRRYCRENRITIAHKGVVGCTAAASRAHEGHFWIMRFSRRGKGVNEIPEGLARDMQHHMGYVRETSVNCITVRDE